MFVADTAPARVSTMPNFVVKDLSNVVLVMSKSGSVLVLTALGMTMSVVGSGSKLTPVKPAIPALAGLGSPGMNDSNIAASPVNLPTSTMGRLSTFLIG